MVASKMWATTARRIIDDLLTSKPDWDLPRNPATGAHAFMVRATVAALEDGWSIPEVKAAWAKAKTPSIAAFEAGLKKTPKLAKRLEVPSQDPGDYVVHEIPQGHLVTPTRGCGRPAYVLAGLYCRCRPALERLAGEGDCVHVRATEAYLRSGECG